MKALDKQDTGDMQTVKSTWRSVLVLKCICGNNNSLSLSLNVTKKEINFYIWSPN